MTWVVAWCFGVACAAVSAVVVPPTPRLGPRLRPYAAHVRRRFDRSADLGTPSARNAAGTPRRSTTAARVIGDEALGRLLRRAGLRDVSPDAFRARRALGGLTGAGVSAATAAAAFRSPTAVLAATIGGGVFGATRPRAQVERRAAARAARVRLELPTVNQLLAIHLRTGAGPVQALQRIVERGEGVLVDELDDVLRAIQAGVPEAEAMRRAANVAADPSAARTYALIAGAMERGADLGDALLALSRDLRDARREEVHKTAVRRRAAMLVPTIAILAPIMLLFIAAPLPSIVFGQR